MCQMYGLIESKTSAVQQCQQNITHGCISSMWPTDVWQKTDLPKLIPAKLGLRAAGGCDNGISPPRFGQPALLWPSLGSEVQVRLSCCKAREQVQQILHALVLLSCRRRAD